MIIKHNIMAINCSRNLKSAHTKVKNSIEKLSSGLRINKASDDAAGLSISQKMSADIVGLKMSCRNAQDGICLIQVADGALNEVSSILQRMVELGTQSSNGTYQNSDRNNIDDELQQLKEEIDRIGMSTNFNGIKLFSGALTGSSMFTIGGIGGTKLSSFYGRKIDGIEIPATDTQTGFNDVSFFVKTSVKNMNFKLSDSNSGSRNVAVHWDGSLYTVTINRDSYKTSSIDANKNEYGNLIVNELLKDNFTEAVQQKYDKAVQKGTIHSSLQNPNVEVRIDKDIKAIYKADTSRSYLSGLGIFQTYSIDSRLNENRINNSLATINTNLKGLKVKFVNDVSKNGKSKAVWTSKNKVTITLATGNESNIKTTFTENNINDLLKTATEKTPGNKPLIGDDGMPFRLKINFDKELTVESDIFAISSTLGIFDPSGIVVGGVGGEPIELQVGTTNERYNKVLIVIDNMSTKGLKINDIDFKTQENSQNNLEKVKSAIDIVSKQRSKLGAIQNRLEHTVKNLMVTTENLVASESRIRDVDIASEMMNFTKNNILIQSAQAMLSQANTKPQEILQLIR